MDTNEVRFCIGYVVFILEDRSVMCSLAESVKQDLTGVKANDFARCANRYPDIITSNLNVVWVEYVGTKSNESQVGL